MLSSPSVDSGQFEVQCNVIINGPVPPSNSSTTNSNSSSTEKSSMLNPPENNSATDLPTPGDAVVSGGGVIRMSDLALVQRCNTLPRNYRKIVHPASGDGTNNPRASPVYYLSPAFSGSQLPSNVEIHQVISSFSFFITMKC